MTAQRVLTIDRSRWRRGGDESGLGQGDTALLNDLGFMCCLGFDALACGVPDAVIHGEADPDYIVAVERFPDYATSSRFVIERNYDDTTYTNSLSVLAAIEHNDDPTLSESERERIIRDDLIALGWDDVVFIDGGVE